LPIAAEKPLSDVRTSAGNVSDGRINVVEFGPKLAKKKVRPYLQSTPQQDVSTMPRSCEMKQLHSGGRSGFTYKNRRADGETLLDAVTAPSLPAVSNCDSAMYRMNIMKNPSIWMFFRPSFSINAVAT
jgi:hypothetical protein